MIEVIREQLNEYRQKRNEHQMQVVALTGAIQALERLLHGDDNKEADDGERTDTAE